MAAVNSVMAHDEIVREGARRMLAAALEAEGDAYTAELADQRDTPQALRSRYQRITAGSPDPAVSWLNWVIRLRDEACLAGTVQATVNPSGHGSIAEIAWVVGTPWQGRGIATEAAQALATWLGQQPVHTVIAHIHPDHRASAAVATAAGLTPTEDKYGGEIRWRRSITR